MKCVRCDVEGVIYRQINKSGSKVVVERCPNCRSNTRPGAAFLSKKGYDWDALPLFEDYTDVSFPCCVEGCERKDTQLHHFAPRHLFGEDADLWPTGYLCTDHHSEWHQKTQTGSYAKRSV